MKKATRYFLTRADLSKGPIALGIEINRERFLIRPDIHLSFHNFQDVGIYRLLNRRVRRTNYGATVILSRSEGDGSYDCSCNARPIARSLASARDDSL